MKNRLGSFLPWILVVISLFVALRNYSPGTYLSGWDTLHPEFDFGLNFSRVFNGVFRDEQGLGAVAGHSHMSEIPRIIELYLLSFAFPKELLRYISILSALIIGPLGVYFFIQRFVRDKLTAFLGGLFYLLNLGTLQQFIVPFEMFTTQYAFLPWLFLYVINFLEKGRRKDLLILVALTFLASPMAYAATLWYAYFLALLVFITTFYLVHKNKEALNRSLLILAFTIILNLFWILPNIYFIFNHAQEVSNSKINTLFSEEAFAQNVSFGNIQDIANFRGFLFNWGVYVGDNRFSQLLELWQKHLDNPLAGTLGFSFFAAIVIGITNELRKRNKIILPILAVFLLSFFFLLSVNPPFGFIFRFIQENIPFFREAIRFPFTKFSILFIFASSVFFAYGLSYLVSLLQKRIRYSQILVFLVVLFSLFYYMWPAFWGNMVSPFMRVRIPDSYFQMFNWFKEQPEGRIAYLPIHSFWGWEYYKWHEKDPSYQGAGFVWFGLKQPILHRDFDRWSSANEQYYREMSYAVYTQDSELFDSVLSKYNISYLLIDKSVIAPGLESQVLYLNEIQDLINQNRDIKKANKFGENIIVYKIPSKSKTYTINNAKAILPKLSVSYQDLAYKDLGPYFYSESIEKESINIPFRNLIDNQNKFLKDIVNVDSDGIVVRIAPLKNSEFKFPKFEDKENLMIADIFAQKEKNNLKINLVPTFPKNSIPLTTTANLPPGEKNFLLSVNQRSFVLNNPPENTPFFVGTVYLKVNSENSISLYKDSDDISQAPDFSALNFSLNSCDLKQKGVLNFNPNKNSLELSAKNSDICLIAPLLGVVPEIEKQRANEILLSANLNSKGSAIPSICLADLKNGSCLSYGIRSANLLFFPVINGSSKDLGLKIYIQSEKDEEKVSFENVSFALRNPIFSVSFGKELLSLSLDYLKEIKENEIKLNFTGYEESGIDISKLPSTSGDCQNNPGPLAPTKKVVKRQQENFVRYTAQNGSFCDHFSFPNLPQNQSYAIIIESRNVEGLPIRLCVANSDSKRCDLYAHLSTSKNFTKDIFLLPSMLKSGGKGYDLNINDLGVKGIRSTNDISSIYIIPFPYNWLSNIASGSSNVTSEKVLVLSSAFEPGFKAYQNGLFGKELAQHVVVNGWANGWILNPNSSNNVYIVYLPQLLEYVGLLALVFCVPIYLLRLKFQAKHGRI